VTCYCIETSGVRHVDFDQDLSNFPFEHLQQRVARFEQLRSSLHETLSSESPLHLLEALNGFGSRLEYTESRDLTRELKLFADATLSLFENVPDLLALKLPTMSLLGRAHETLASIKVLKGRSIGPSAASFILTALLPSTVVSWNEASRQRCGFKSNPPYGEFLRRVQEMGICLARQIPPASEFAALLKNSVGANSTAQLLEFVLHPIN